MKDRKLKNVAASIRQRLLNAAKASNRPFQEVLQYFAMERFLYRLSQSAHADRFVLKGALMLTAWRIAATRATKDIDLLGRLPSESVADAIRAACRQDVEADGLVFDPESVTESTIKEGADYEGVRISFRGSLQNVPITMQIDVGFGDVVYPPPAVAEYPTILDHPPPKLRAYSKESVVAEKFEAMVKLGLLNSRMKDFHDVWLLSRRFVFDGITLAAAIEKTFNHRGTLVSSEPTAFSAAFTSDPNKIAQWRGFVKKTRLVDVPGDFAEVVAAITLFLSPPAKAIQTGNPFAWVWHSPGPWVIAER